MQPLFNFPFTHVTLSYDKPLLTMTHDITIDLNQQLINRLIIISST